MIVDLDDDFDWQVFRRHRRRKKRGQIDRTDRPVIRAHRTTVSKPTPLRRVRRAKAETEFITRDEAAALVGVSSFLFGRIVEKDPSSPRIAFIEKGKKHWVRSDVRAFAAKMNRGWDPFNGTFSRRHLVDD